MVGPIRLKCIKIKGLIQCLTPAAALSRKELFAGENLLESGAKDVTPEISAAFAAKKINLDALFDGANPFEEADGPVPRSNEEMAASEGAA
jgi:hypothetical protein